MDKSLLQTKRLKEIILSTSLLILLPFTPSILAQQITSYTYSDDGLVLSEDGPRTDVVDITTYTYDVAGNRASITNALGHITQLLDYNGRGQPGKIISPNSVETLLTYNVRGWLETTTIVDPSGDASLNSVTQYEYDGIGQIIKITLPNGVVINYTYDTARRLTGISNSLGESINYTLDNAGNRTAETINNSGGGIIYSVTRAFDELSRVMDIIGAENQTTHFDYDVNDNNTAVTDPRTNTTNQTYDPLDRLQQITDAANGITQFDYDDQDRLASVTDANGNTTTYTYDAFDNLTQVSSPDTGITIYSYDNANNRTSMIDARGVVVNYSYDALNRLTNVTYPATPEENITYTYDNAANGNKGIGRLSQLMDQSGSTNYSYDHRGNLLVKITSINSQTFTTSYSYDLGNNPINITYPSGLVVNHSYDTQGRISGISATRLTETANSIISNTEYLAFGPVKGMAYGNGLTNTLTYDQDYRLNTLNTGSALGTVLDLSYDYDLNGNIITLDHLNQSANNQSFSYDVLNRLSGSSGEYGVLSYQYDSIGNRLQKSTIQNAITDTESYSYSAGSNQLNNINPSTTNTDRSFTYDSNGNPLQINNTDATTEALTSTYNAANRLATITKPSVTANYTYNALGQRATKQIVGNATTYYTYNESGQLQGEYNAQGQVIKEYLWFNGQPLAQVTSTNIYSYHNDHLGTPRALTDENKNIVWQASYTPFGEAIQTIATVENNIRFPGQYFDAETELHYNWQRYYDSTTGRYLQSDRIGLGDGLNTYGYVHQNPLGYYDPTGLNGLIAFGGLLYESYNGLRGKGFNGCRVYGALIDGYNGEGSGFAAALGEDVLSFGGGALGALAKGLLATRLALFTKGTKTTEQQGRKLGDKIRGQRGAVGESPPKLQRIHSDDTILAGSNRFSFDHWSKQATDDIVKSLRPGSVDSLKIKPDGRVFDGNTRIKVLQDRGFDVNSLPREVLN